MSARNSRAVCAGGKNSGLYQTTQIATSSSFTPFAERQWLGAVSQPQTAAQLVRKRRAKKMMQVQVVPLHEARAFGCDNRCKEPVLAAGLAGFVRDVATITRRRAPPHRLNCCYKNPRPWSWLEYASQLLRSLLRAAHRLRGRVRGAVGVGRSQAQEEGTFVDLAVVQAEGGCGRAQWDFRKR